MADKSNFTPDEWRLLLESMTMAGIAISAADPSGLWGLLKESFAEGSALVAAKTDSTARPLIKALVADFQTAEGRSSAPSREGGLFGAKSGPVSDKEKAKLQQISTALKLAA